jgi:hypothetical protein
MLIGQLGKIEIWVLDWVLRGRRTKINDEIYWMLGEVDFKGKGKQGLC